MCRIFWSSYSSFIQRSGPIRQFGSRPLKIRANDAVMWLRPGLELFVMASLAGIDPIGCLLPVMRVS